MPKKLINDYKFYKIVCLDNSIDLCYVGSTANWKQRQISHKSSCNNQNSKSYNYKIYKDIRANGGWTNFKMVEIGEKEQLTTRQAEYIEDLYRDELKANMNDKRCYRTEEQKQNYHQKYNQEKYQANKEYYKEYYQANKEEIKAKAKKYREAKKVGK